MQFALDQLSLPVMHSIRAMSTAIKARFVVKHRTMIDALERQLSDSIDDLPLSDAPRASRSFWDSPPHRAQYHPWFTKCCSERE